MRLAPFGIAALVAAGLVGCGGDDSGSDARAARSACEVLVAWTDDTAEVVNRTELEAAIAAEDACRFVTRGQWSTTRWSRREVLLAGAATALVAACGGGDDGGGDAGGAAASVDGTTTTGTPTPTTAAAGSVLRASDFEALATCTLTPEQTAGPFPLDEQFDRRDITEGYPGHPLRLGFRVVDAACAPVPGAAVEVWHTDATGDYSAFADGGSGKDEADGTTFLRGTQVAGDDGIVEFATIYPGWYGGRAVHIHVRVHADGSTVLTSQVYFDEDHTLAVYEAEPYAEFGPPDTVWADDQIAGDPEADGTALALSASGSGTLALLNLGVA